MTRLIDNLGLNFSNEKFNEALDPYGNLNKSLIKTPSPYKKWQFDAVANDDINGYFKNPMLEISQEIRNAADIVIDSSALNIHQLEKKVNDYFNQSSDVDLKVNILSFGYKYGIPVDADLVMDCRFIANPHWDPKLRPLTGRDKSVSKAVLESSNVEEFLERYQLLFDTLAKGFITEGRKFLTLAIGCTGGKHRSVAITEELVTRLANGKNLSNYRIQTHGIHRDLGREI